MSHYQTKRRCESGWFDSLKPDSNGCLIWRGYKTKSGYGQITREGKVLYTHRLAWELVNGEIPPGKHLHHKCENPACCNPSHIELHTPMTHRLEHAKLKDEELENIVRMRESGLSLRAIANEYEVEHHAVSRLLRKAGLSTKTDQTKEWCKKGHSLTDPNNVRIYTDKRGYNQRHCLACKRGRRKIDG